MLPKPRRLTAEEVQNVLTAGRSARSTLLSAKYVANTGPLRVSAVVSKKVAKRAVERNRLRRALYRALADVDMKGTAVVFVQKVPEGALTPAFREDLLVLAGKL